MARTWAAGADVRGAAHHVQLVRVFHQAHFIEQGTQVALLRGHQHALAHARAHRGQPAFHARSQAGVGGKRVPDLLAVFQQARQQGVEFGKRVRSVHPQGGGRGLGAQAVAVPDFALQVFGRAKQRAVALRR